MIIISIYDKAAENFNNPVSVENEKVGIRYFKQLENEPFVEEYELWKLADYDNKTGKIREDLKRITTGLWMKQATEKAKVVGHAGDQSNGA